MVLAAVTLAALWFNTAKAEETFPLQFKGAPPVNVGARDTAELIANHGFVGHFLAPEPGRKGGVKLRLA